MGQAIKTHRHRSRCCNRSHAQAVVIPQVQTEGYRSTDQHHINQMIDQLKAGHPAHLLMHRTQKLAHRIFGISQLTARVAK